MTAHQPQRPTPAAPLEADEPGRARDLKLKIAGRLRDVSRHLVALRSAMAGFGENFELDEFTRAHASADPDELNRVKAVERGVDQLYNYAAELTAFGLELALLRARGEETNARRDFQKLRDAGILSRERVDRLQRLRELRRSIVHEYDEATAAQIHEAAWIVADDFPVFADAYMKWLKAGFRGP